MIEQLRTTPLTAQEREDLRITDMRFCDIDTMLEELYRRGIQTLLVEGGEQTLQTFINRGLWDEAWEEQSHVRLESGVPAPRMPIGTEHSTETLFGVNISHWRNR